MTVPVSNIYVRFSNTAIDYTGFGMNVANVNSNANASIMKLNVNGNTVLRITMDGYIQESKQTVWVPSRSMVPSSTNGAAIVYYETPTSKIVQPTFIFRPSTTNTSTQFDVLMPRSWNTGNIKYRVYFSPEFPGSSATMNTVWFMESVAISPTDLLDPVMTMKTKVVAQGNSNTVMYMAESENFRIDGNPKEGDLVVFKLTREATNTLDTLNQWAKLFGVEIILNA